MGVSRQDGEPPQLPHHRVNFSAGDASPRVKPEVPAKPRFQLPSDNKENIKQYRPRVVIRNPSKYNEADSDDEDINYRDDDEDDDEDDNGVMNSLAAKVARKDSLEKLLTHRSSRKELVERNIIPMQTDQERAETREEISNRLERRLSFRPTPVELEQRNILRQLSPSEAKQQMEERKILLLRKLSFRPTIEDLREWKIIQFNDYVEVTEAHMYDRKADKPWTRLTPKDKAAIRKELNDFKASEMPVHEQSRHLTRFHRP